MGKRNCQEFSKFLLFSYTEEINNCKLQCKYTITYQLKIQKIQNKFIHTYIYN